LTICGRIRVRLTRGDHRYVGKDGELGEIARLSVTNADRCLALHQHQGHRLADNIAGADHDNVLALDFDALVFEQLHDAVRSARRKYGVADDQPADIVKMKSVDIFFDRDGLKKPGNRKTPWQWQLYEDAVDGRISQLFHSRQHFRRGSVGRKVEAL
jgi:hypothetical protein